MSFMATESRCQAQAGGLSSSYAIHSPLYRRAAELSCTHTKCTFDEIPEILEIYIEKKELLVL